MYAKTSAAVIAALVVVGCSGSEPPASEDTTAGSVQLTDTSEGVDSGGISPMAGMDHGSMAGMPAMEGGTQSAPGAGMAVMDHSVPGMTGSAAQASGGRATDHANMAGMTGSTAQASASGAMDHANMPGMQDDGAVMDRNQMNGSAAGSGAQASPGAMPAMDHSRMQMAPATQGASAGPAPGQMPAMNHGDMNMATPVLPQAADHAQMPGMQQAGGGAEDEGMEKLRALVAELVQDPAVQREIQGDTALSQRWADEGVRRVLLDRP